MVQGSMVKEVELVVAKTEIQIQALVEIFHLET